MEKLCSNCKWCLLEQYGYSNYTIEGTTLSCIRGLNPPLGGLELEYNTVEEALRFAEKCDHFVEGEGPVYDVDGEVTAEDYRDDPELYALLKNRE